MKLRIILNTFNPLSLYYHYKIMKLSTESRETLNQALSQCGLRSTRQREQVYSILLGKHDHPTADEIYNRAKEEMPPISLATVYNCLDTLVECGLARQVNFERESTRYCPHGIEKCALRPLSLQAYGRSARYPHSCARDNAAAENYAKRLPCGKSRTVLPRDRAARE